VSVLFRHRSADAEAALSRARRHQLRRL